MPSWRFSSSKWRLGKPCPGRPRAWVCPLAGQRGPWQLVAAGRDGSYVAGALRLALISGLPFASAET
jgi:hypothetical protein